MIQKKCDFTLADFNCADENRFNANGENSRKGSKKRKETFLFRYYMLCYFFALAVKKYNNNNNKNLATG